MPDPQMRKPAGPIAIFLSSLSGGGAERAMVNLANRFVECGIETHMVLGRREGPYLTMLDPRVRIVNLGVRRMLKSLSPLNAYMKSERPAVLMPALAHTQVISIIGKLIFRWPTQLILSVQNTPSASAGISNQKIERHWPIFVRLLYQYADKIIAISEGVSNDIRTLTNNKSSPFVINNPVVTPEFFKQLEENIDHPWLKDKSVPTLLAVGRLTIQKDYPTMLAAFAKLISRRPARLIILGDGELRNEMEDLAKTLGISEHIYFGGFVSNPYAWMKAVDLFILSSRWEGLANVIAESLACGTPVVSTDCQSGPAEILENETYGILTPVAQPTALADAIETALGKSWNIEALKGRGADFGVESIVEKYLTVLFDIPSEAI